MATKIHLRAGEVELSLESDNPLAISDIKDFISQIESLAQSLVSPPRQVHVTTNSHATADAQIMLEHAPLQLHVNSVADRIGAKSGPEVVIAAAAHLQIMKSKKSFTRRELIETLKLATNHYNQNIGSNLTAILKTLCGSKLNQIANDTYSLRSNELSELRGKLAE
jgi:hypothetical protein